MKQQKINISLDQDKELIKKELLKRDKALKEKLQKLEKRMVLLNASINKAEKTLVGFSDKLDDILKLAY